MKDKSKSDEPTIPSDVAELIACGVVAEGAANLELYRREVELIRRGLLRSSMYGK
jgi:hypothetical protein